MKATVLLSLELPYNALKTSVHNLVPVNYYQPQYLKTNSKLKNIEAFLSYGTSHSRVTMAMLGTVLSASFVDYRETMGKIDC